MVSGVEVNIDNMNVIVIFTEGMASQVLDINNNLNLNLTPNLTNFSKESGVLNVQN